MYRLYGSGKNKRRRGASPQPSSWRLHGSLPNTDTPSLRWTTVPSPAGYVRRTIAWFATRRVSADGLFAGSQTGIYGQASTQPDTAGPSVRHSERVVHQRCGPPDPLYQAVWK